MGFPVGIDPGQPVALRQVVLVEPAEAMVSVLLFCGLRASELRGLPRDALELREQPRLTVRQRADKWQQIGPVKTKNSRRTVPVPPGTAKALRRWLLAAPPSKQGLVFPNGRGRVESYANIWNRLWRPLMAEAGLADRDTGKPLFGLHTLRHAAVSLWIYQGVQPKQVSQWAGHHSVQFTLDVYGHLWPDAASDAAIAAGMEAALK